MLRLVSQIARRKEAYFWSPDDSIAKEVKIMANIQLYTQPIENYYSTDQIEELDKKLDSRLIKRRKEGGRTLEYIQGHTAIDQANRIFGYGNWGWRVLDCVPHTIIDPISGEGIGVVYQAKVEVWVRGMQGVIVDVGSQPVSVSSVEEQVMGRRINDAKSNHTDVDESPFTLLEKKNARAVIVQAHEQAQKGAATDGLKRTLRGLGNQFANGLYGDGQVDLSHLDGQSVESGNPAPQSQKQQPKQLHAAIDPIIKAANDGLKKAASAAKQRAASNGLDWEKILDESKITSFETGKDIATVNRIIDALISESKAS
jgi:Recombination DNA repair protein (RAD52 pathway)